MLLLKLIAAAVIGLFATQSNGSVYEITDSFGKHRFENPPRRVVVTDWTLLQQLLDLGVAPIGAPELDRFRHYVDHAALPPDISDIGLRRSPSLSALKKLRPDLIILGTNQKSLARPLSKIAYVLYYQSFSERYRTNGKKSQVRFLQLAELFQKSTLAEQKLAQRDARIAQLKQQLQQRCKHALPKVSLLRFSGEKNALLYGNNSMPQHALSLLGLQTPVTVKKNRWGEKEVPLTKLAEVNEGYLMYFLPVDQARVLQSASWNQLPLVQKNQAFAAGKHWSYGGAMSIGGIAESVANLLMQHACP